MKRLIVLLLLLNLSLISLFSPLETLAQENLVNQELAVLPKDKTINSDYFSTGETVVLSGTVNGDAYLFGGKIIVDGTVNGDLITGGGTLEIKGNVTQDVRAGGGQIIVSGQIGNNLTVGGGSVSISEAARIGGSLVAGAGSLTISAPITKGATIGGGDITLANSIGGNVNAGAEQLLLTNNAQIRGDLNYWSNENLDIQPPATVSGQINHRYPQTQNDFDSKDFEAFFEGIGRLSQIINILSALVLGLLFINLLPNFSNRVVNNIRKAPLMNFLIGILAFVAIPVLFVALLATVVGIPLAFILLFAFIVDLFIVKIFISMWLGDKILGYLNQKVSPNAVFLVGLLAYILLTSLPFIGWLVSFIAVPLGLGALLISKRDSLTEMRSKKLI